MNGSVVEKLLHHEGWLDKMSPSQVKGWQKRWVVLHGPTIRYWRDQEEYQAEKSPSGIIHAHTVLSIDPHPDHLLEFHMKVLRSRVDLRKYEWRIWTGNDPRGGRGKPGAKGKNSVSAEAWNTRVLWLTILDEWCEKYLLERLFSRFHVRKPAKFIDEIMGLDQDSEGEEEAKSATTSGPGRGGARASILGAQPQLVSSLESYLDKRSPGFFALWQRRWFVYLEAEDMIVYYKSREEYLHGSEPVGSFQIADLNTVEGIGGMDGREMHLETMTAPDLSEPVKKQKKKNATVANGPVTPTSNMKIRTYKLRALTTESRDQWVSQLKARINVKSKAAVLRRAQNQLKPQSFSANSPTAGSRQRAASSEGATRPPLITARSTPVRTIRATTLPTKRHAVESITDEVTESSANQREEEMKEGQAQSSSPHSNGIHEASSTPSRSPLLQAIPGPQAVSSSLSLVVNIDDPLTPLATITTEPIPTPVPYTFSNSSTQPYDH